MCKKSDLLSSCARLTCVRNPVILKLFFPSETKMTNNLPSFNQFANNNINNNESVCLLINTISCKQSC